MSITKINTNLFLIDLNQNMTGFKKFISSWLYVGDNITIIVDPGPISSIEFLIYTLKKLGVSKIDHILLTHIHIDHAGGAGLLLRQYPMANVNCHPKGISHMVDPEKLWQGSVKVLGDIAILYGKISPVDKNKIQFQNNIDTGDGIIQVLETPGHASHHLSYLFQDFLFAGEVAGVILATDNGIYKRPATPPKFKLEVCLNSLEKLKNLDFNLFCFGHYGADENPKQIIKEAEKQLQLWVEIAKKESAKGEESVEDRIVDRLLIEDDLFTVFAKLPSDIKQRENYFIRNTIKGMLQSL